MAYVRIMFVSSALLLLPCYPSYTQARGFFVRRFGGIAVCLFSLVLPYVAVRILTSDVLTREDTLEAVSGARPFHRNAQMLYVRTMGDELRACLDIEVCARRLYIRRTSR